MNVTDSNSAKGVLPEEKLLRLNDWAEPAGWVLAIFALLVGLFLLMVEPARSSSFDGSLRPILGAAWVIFGLFMAGGARAGIVVHREGISVQGTLRKRHCSWNQLAGFQLSKSLLKPGLVVRRRDGKEIRVVSLWPASAKERTLGEAMVEELNRRAGL
jgi:hypothetical protein